MSRHREISRIIYALKRQWGTVVSISREVTTLDVDNGIESSEIMDSITIKRGILLPLKMKTDFAYDLSYIAANKPFTYGGHFSKSKRLLLIDASDMINYTLTQGDTVVVNSRRYVIENLDDYEYVDKTVAWMVTIINTGADLDVQ